MSKDDTIVHLARHEFPPIDRQEFKKLGALARDLASVQKSLLQFEDYCRDHQDFPLIYRPELLQDLLALSYETRRQFSDLLRKEMFLRQQEQRRPRHHPHPADNPTNPEPSHDQ
jgi:hypothetical protein